MTRHEVMFHLRLCFGAEAPVFSLTTEFPWKEEYDRSMAEGLDAEKSLDAVQRAIVAIHQLLAGMLADIYFLWLNPLHEPRLFALKPDEKPDRFPADWLDTVFVALRDVQARRLAEYERALREKEQSKDLVPVVPKQEDEWQTIGKYKVKEGLAIDTETGLMWLRFAVGQRWENEAVKGEDKHLLWKQTYETTMEFNKAGGYGGYADWGLPSVDNLKKLIDREEGGKSRMIDFISNAVFPGNPNLIRSCSPYDGDSMWCVNFHDGSVIGGIKNSSPVPVRLVRKL